MGCPKSDDNRNMHSISFWECSEFFELCKMVWFYFTSVCSCVCVCGVSEKILTNSHTYVQQYSYIVRLYRLYRLYIDYIDYFDMDYIDTTLLKQMTHTHAHTHTHMRERAP